MFINTINKIRDILRSEGITSEDSIKYCVAFLVCRFLDEERCTKLGIPEKYSFNNLY